MGEGESISFFSSTTLRCSAPSGFNVQIWSLAAVAPRDVIVVDESATSLPYVLRYLPFATPGSFFGSKTGTLGWGMGAALGVQLASPGRTVVASHGTMARIWDLATGKPFGPPMQHQGEIVSVAFRPDGRAILTAGGFTARLWDAVTGNPPRAAYGRAPKSLC